MSAENFWTRKTVAQRLGFIIAAATALFWLYFVIAVLTGEGKITWAPLFWPGLAFLLPVVLALRWEAVGGIFLIAVATVAIFFFRMWMKPEMFLICAGPLILGGLLLIPYGKIITGR